MSLAPEFAKLASLMRLYRGSVPAQDALPRVRLSTSRWIGRHQLEALRSVRTRDCVHGGRRHWRTFTPSRMNEAAAVFYVHGGGLVFYSVQDFDSTLRHLAVQSECEITAFDYLKAPEHGFDEIAADLAQSVEARLARCRPSQRLAIAGDSIGGYLAALLCVGAFRNRFRRLVLLYPVLDVRRERPSYERYGRGYLLDAEMMRWFQRLCEAGAAARALDLFAMTPQKLAALPETYLFSSEYDVLRDEAMEWARYLEAQGKRVVHHHFEELPHDFCLYAGSVPQARCATARIAASLAVAEP